MSTQNEEITGLMKKLVATFGGKTDDCPLYWHFEVLLVPSSLLSAGNHFMTQTMLWIPSHTFLLISLLFLSE